MKINIREVNREWAVDLETPDKIQSIYFKSRQNALSFVKYLELADNVIKLDKKELQTPMTNYDRIKAMSVEEMAKWLAIHIDNYKAPYDVKEIYRNAIDVTTGKGIIWIEAFKQWLESEATE